MMVNELEHRGGNNNRLLPPPTGWRVWTTGTGQSSALSAPAKSQLVTMWLDTVNSISAKFQQLKINYKMVSNMNRVHQMESHSQQHHLCISEWRRATINSSCSHLRRHRQYWFTLTERLTAKNTKHHDKPTNVILLYWLFWIIPFIINHHLTKIDLKF